MQTLWQDLRYGARMLLKKPGFTLIAVLTLAIGVGLNAAIFSIVNAVILRPLPFQQPEQLAQIWESKPATAGDDNVVSPANFLDWQAQVQSFAAMSMYNAYLPGFTHGDETVQLIGVSVSANFFETLGVAPLLGRTFASEEEQVGKNRVVVISHNFWQRRLGSDPQVIGRTLLLGEAPCVIVGVLRPDFRQPKLIFGQQAEIWRPLAVATLAGGRAAKYVNALGRLRAGVSLDQARTELQGIAQRLALAYPQTNTDWGVTLVPLHKEVTGQAGLWLFILQCAVGCVLLIACVNVANLMLTRLAAREREVAIRTALGAHTWRVVRLLLAESTLLALAGGALGLLVAWWGVDLLKALAPPELPRLEEIEVNRPVLVFTLLLSLATVMFFGLLPAWRTARINLNEALKQGNRAATRKQGGRGALVVAETALAMVLLVSAGLLARSLLNLQRVPLGYQTENLLTLRVSLPQSKARDGQQVSDTFQQMLARVEAVPGVRGAALTSSLPLGRMNNITTNFTIAGRPADAPGAATSAGFRIITPGYLRVLDIPLRQGRGFAASDTPTSPKVILINETFARRYFPNADPLGQQLIYEWGKGRSACEIIGIMGDFKHEGVEQETKPEMYVPQTQFTWSNGTMVVSTTVAPDTLTAAVQKAIWEVEKNAPVWRAATIRRILSETLAAERFNALLLSIFSGVALSLAAVGLFGVMSYTVTQRRQEIGLRLALGAQGRDVVRLVVGRGLRLVLLGVALGIAISVAATRAMQTLLFGVSASDPLTFTVIALLLTLVALLACWIPARRATKVDPMVALRCE